MTGAHSLSAAGVHLSSAPLPAAHHDVLLMRPGARTGLSGLITGGVVGLVLLCMTPVFEQLPLNVMGAIVVRAVRAACVSICVCVCCMRKTRERSVCPALLGVQFFSLRTPHSASLSPPPNKHTSHTHHTHTQISGVSGLLEYEEAVRLFKVCDRRKGGKEREQRH